MNTLPESMNTLPESMNTLSESMNTLLESMNTLPESMNTLPESMNTLPESMNTLPESMNTLSESMNTLPESINTLPESVNALPAEAITAFQRCVPKRGQEFGSAGEDAAIGRPPPPSVTLLAQADPLTRPELRKLPQIVGYHRRWLQIAAGDGVVRPHRHEAPIRVPLQGAELHPARWKIR